MVAKVLSVPDTAHVVVKPGKDSAVVAEPKLQRTDVPAVCNTGKSYICSIGQMMLPKATLFVTHGR
jgi:hypothetical protein